MHPFIKRLEALEAGGTNSTVELVCVELAAHDQGRQIEGPLWAEWREQRFERIADEGAQAFRDRVRAAVCSQLPPAAARSLLFLEGSDRDA